MADIERLQAVIAAAEELMARMDVVEEALRGIGVFHMIYDLQFSVPNYYVEKAALQDAIKTAKGGE